MGGSRKKTQTVGYRYGLTVHMGVCYGPVDQVVKILADDRDVYVSPITSSSIVGISAPSLFGGDDKEGGLSGRMHVQMGDAGQAPSPLLTSLLGAAIPAFRGILGFVYTGIMSANNPYLKPFSFVVQRIMSGWQGGEAWYSSKAKIGLNMNPAHIVYECLTNTDWGMGYPTAAMDDGNFRAVADVLYDEGFGLSMIWNQQDDIESFIGIIFNHIAGSLNVDPATGLYQIKLIRFDYDPDTLPIFDHTSISELASYQRAGWGELVNEVTITYTDGDTYQETAITVQNLATIQVQGGVVNQTLSYTGITSDDIAQRVAQRELLARSSPLAKVQFKVNRKAWRLMPNDVFVFAWEKLGISGIIMRVASVSAGTYESGMITIDAIEDVFGLPQSSYTNQQGSGWEDPLQPTAPSPSRIFTEVTYYDLATTMSPADLSYVDPDDGYPVMFAASPSVSAYDYKLLTAPHTSGAYKEVDQSAHCPIGTILAALAKEEHTTVDFFATAIGDVEIGSYAVVNGEYMRIDSMDTVGGHITLTRGVLDTVPAEHVTNSLIYFAEHYGAADPATWPTGSMVDAKVITRTGTGSLDPSLAPVDTVTIAARHSKPYPPAAFRISGEYLPESVSGAVVVTWYRRNRITQDSNLIAQDEADIAPEVGQTTTIKIYDQDGALCRTLTGLSGTSYTYPISDELTDCGGLQTHLTVELLSVRDGVESWQSHTHRFERVYTGFGFEYGDDWGGA